MGLYLLSERLLKSMQDARPVLKVHPALHKVNAFKYGKVM